MLMLASKRERKVIKARVLETMVYKALSRSRLPDIDYALNPYIGCWHSCTYCYARLYVKNSAVSKNWGNVVLVKKNIVEVLSREVKNLRLGVVGIGTITDAYQPIEAIYSLTRRSIGILLKEGFQVSIQTKNPLILRDLDLLEKYRDRVDVGLTITTFNSRVAEFIEPRAPPPKARANALHKVSEVGVKTWIFYGPVIPSLNDDDSTIDEIIELAKDTGSEVLVDRLHIKNFMHKPHHPLNKLISLTKKYEWRDFLTKVMNKCLKARVKCMEAFTETYSQRALEEFI